MPLTRLGRSLSTGTHSRQQRRFAAFVGLLGLLALISPLRAAMWPESRVGALLICGAAMEIWHGFRRRNPDAQRAAWYSGGVNATLSQQKFRQTTEELFYALGKPLIISEYAYPSTPLIFGPFGSFNHAGNGFPLTKQGQKTWLKDFLNWAESQLFIAGTFYFSPEFYRVIWGPFSLFTYFGKAKPAIDVFEDFNEAERTNEAYDSKNIS